MPLTSLPLSDLPLWFKLAVALFFVAANGFFVAAEFALVKVRQARLEAKAEAGDGRARVGQHLLDNLDLYLSSCQLGITGASLVLGWLAEPAVAEVLIAMGRAVGLEIEEGGLIRGIAIALAFAIITILHMTIGEQAPKIWAIQRPEPTVLAVAYPLRIFTAVLQPFIYVINAISNWLLGLAGLDPATGEHEAHSTEELGAVLVASARAGHLTGKQVDFARNVLGMVALEARHVLVPRVDVVYLRLDAPLEENLDKIRETGHSRFPLCETDLDSVVGIVHAKRMTAQVLAGHSVDLRKIAVPPAFVPDTQKLGRMIVDLQKGRTHAAICLDDHGTAIGMVFLEDALEEIVGPIYDEFDAPQTDAVREVSPGVYEVKGSLPAPEAQQRFGIDGIEDDTVGGYVVTQLGRLPKVDDEIVVSNTRFTVLEVIRHRAARIRIELDPQQAAPSE